MARALASFVAVAVLGVGVAPFPAEASHTRRDGGGAGDATVIAVIDNAFTPYHWDYLASKMPQATDFDRGNDVPLDRAPHTWLPGFPRPSAFKSYRSLDLTLEEKEEMTPIAALDEKDAKKWERVKQSDAKSQHFYWMPGTKVIGALDFAGNQIHGNENSHGTGTSSVSVGNIHGTCPECLLVFISYSGQASGEAAINWAMKQPWIDAITNSYGFSITPVTRDRFYSGSNTKLQRKASKRGQTIFFSAGNGQGNAFLIPNTTLLSSQEGPDWIVTVGAVSPGAHASYTGHGKPADVAGIGSGYPAAYGSPNVGGTGPRGFGGTSNATPQVAGLYARALFRTRDAMNGRSRRQWRGVIARGGGVRCAPARRNCEIADRKLTANELRNRLFKGAVHTEAGMTPAGVGSMPVVADEEYLNEGHGSYFGREKGPESNEWLKEFNRIVGPLFGRAKPLKRPAGERQWMTVASYCRQHLWGRWNGGYYRDGASKLPGPDSDYPVRSAIEAACPFLQPLP